MYRYLIRQTERLTLEMTSLALLIVCLLICHCLAFDHTILKGKQANQKSNNNSKRPRKVVATPKDVKPKQKSYQSRAKQLQNTLIVEHSFDGIEFFDYARIDANEKDAATPSFHLNEKHEFDHSKLKVCLFSFANSEVT